MSGLTVSCSVAALGPTPNDKSIHEDIYKELMKVVEEDLIKGIQLYPSGWPRKLQISVADIELKNKIIVEGLDLFGVHVDFSDEDSVVTKVVLKDAPMEWENALIADNMSRYGEVIRVEKEMLKVDGRITNCTTGDRHIFMSTLNVVIPNKLEVKVGAKTFSLSVWYRGQTTKSNTSQQKPKACFLCGSDSHDSKNCTHSGRVCFTCHKSDHTHTNCPNNDGSKRSEDVLIFYNSKCPLSNWNKEYPFHVDDKEYICVEQYVMEEKCLNFGDSETAEKVMNETDPKIMRRLGDDIANYDHRDWMKRVKNVVYTGVTAKFSDESARGAKDYLLDTGNLTIGEATRNSKWGTGIHVSEPQALLKPSWTGSNCMGTVLMNVRQKLVSRTGDDNENEMEVEKNGIDKNDSFLDQLKTPDSNCSSPQPTQWAVVIGDSNVVGLPMDDDGLPMIMNLRRCTKGGTTLAHIPDHLAQCDLSNEQVDVMVLHVGTCEWDIDTEVDDAETVYDRYKDALNVISTQYARAEIIISSIPYRRPIGNSKLKAESINKQIAALNEKLRALSDTEDNVQYVDNTEGIPLDESVYKDSVHFNEKGRFILAEKLKNCIREGYAKNALNLGHEWKVSHTP